MAAYGRARGHGAVGPQGDERGCVTIHQMATCQTYNEMCVQQSDICMSMYMLVQTCIRLWSVTACIQVVNIYVNIHCQG